MPRIVDPRPLVEQRLNEIDAVFTPRLRGAEQAVNEASTRRGRKESKKRLHSIKREHRTARREAQRLLGVPVAWFTLPRR